METSGFMQTIGGTTTDNSVGTVTPGIGTIIYPSTTDDPKFGMWDGPRQYELPLCWPDREGWICPKCNRALSPDVKECVCYNAYPYRPYEPYRWIPNAPQPWIIWYDNDTSGTSTQIDYFNDLVITCNA